MTSLKGIGYYCFSLPACKILSLVCSDPCSIKLSYSAETYLAWTIDVEGGYVNDKRERIWMRQDPNSHLGYSGGFSSWLDFFDQYQIKATFFITTQGFNFEPDNYRNLISRALQAGHEIGLHLHPAEDRVLAKQVGRPLLSNSSKFYQEKEIREMLSAERLILTKYLGDMAENIKSFRWGNWGLNSKEILSLVGEYGFNIDSSAVPGRFGHLDDDRFFDWRHYEEESWRSDGCQEIPITTFSLLGKRFHLDPALGFLTAKLISKVVRAHKAGVAFVLLSHSTEMVNQKGGRSYLFPLAERMQDELPENCRYCTLTELKDMLCV